MNPLMIFALTLALALHPSSVKPGEEISVSLYGNGTYLLEVSDPDIYFSESLSNKIVATPGSYELRVGFETTPGMKSIFVRHENGSLVEIRYFLVLPLSEADLGKLVDLASEMEREFISLKNQINLLKDEIKQKEAEIERLKNQPGVNDEKIRELENQISDLKSQVLSKENEVYKLKIKISDLNNTARSLQDQVVKLQSEKNILESQMAKLGSPEFLEATKLGFFFIVAFTAGILISLLRR
ncbi:hypothetical protein DRP07_01230 [Archaeoglobales archaeon]|nr:MAG: hypothetical protein DRP07_01230 [Archaeoglobales archaeon]